MKAKLYYITHNGKKFVFASYKNSISCVTIKYMIDNIYSIMLLQGDVIYDNFSKNIDDIINNHYTEGQEILESNYEVSNIIKHVWRPGLVTDITTVLEIDEGEEKKSKKELFLLMKRLEDILLYIEPTEENIHTIYGHKTRELLILSCTELENRWSEYIKLSCQPIDRMTTRDYVKLKEKLFLNEYKVTFNNHPFSLEKKPFFEWDNNCPTRSLYFYNAYNEVKHDSYTKFNQATLAFCIYSIMSNIIMHCVRYSPYSLLHSQDSCSTLFNEYFSLELESPSIEYFYIPNLEPVKMASGAFYAPDASRLLENWRINNFTL